MSKISLVMSSMIGGGAEKMLMYIANQLSLNEENDIILILFMKKGENLKKLNSKIKIIDLNSKLGIKGIFKLLKVLKEINSEIIFISLGPLNAVFSLFLFLFKKNKVIARETNIPTIINKMKSKTNKIYKLIDLLYKFTYKFYDLIIVQSNDMKNDLIINYKIPSKKIRKINNLVDFDLINNSLYIQNDEKKLNFLFKENRIYGISMGRLTNQKGFDLLIEKMRKIKSQNIIIYILGEGEEKENLEEKIKKYKLADKIKILPFDANPYKYLNKSDFFIFPSRVEGFPNALIEALGCGLPAIASNCLGGINEIIISGFNGEILDFNQDIELENVITKILNYNKEKIQKDIEVRFNKEKILEEYMGVFK